MDLIAKSGRGLPAGRQLPHHQHLPRAEVLEAVFQTRPVVASAGRPVLVNVPLIDPDGEHSVPLQTRVLPVIGSRYPHVPDEHFTEAIVECVSVKKSSHDHSVNIFREEIGFAREGNAFSAFGVKAH